jgi:hypothetical protein
MRLEIITYWIEYQPGEARYVTALLGRAPTPSCTDKLRRPHWIKSTLHLPIRFPFPQHQWQQTPIKTSPAALYSLLAVPELVEVDIQKVFQQKSSMLIPHGRRMMGVASR